MEELEKEAEIESKILETIERSAKAMVSALYNVDFSMSDFSYSFRNNEGVYWIEFSGYANKRLADDTLLIAKEVFRSVAYKFGIVFIDESLSSTRLAVS